MVFYDFSSISYQPMQRENLYPSEKNYPPPGPHPCLRKPHTPFEESIPEEKHQPTPPPPL